MKNKKFWSFATLFVVAWALYEMHPLRGRSLIDVFEQEAVNTDTNLPPAAAQERLKKIVEAARRLEQERPGRTFGNLREAIGTNVITNYFAYIDVKAQKDPTQAILHQLQRQAAGQIKLGLDLQGGTSFLVMMDTNALASLEDRSYALEQAVEVLRKRVDRFGVAEPIIQPAGEDRILIQLPGLSEAEKESARTTIQKAAFLEFRMVHPDSNTLIQQGVIEPGYEVLQMPYRSRTGQEGMASYLVKKKPERGLTGKHVKRAYPNRNPMTGELEIDFTLNDEGAGLFADITREHQGELLAIVLDGELYSAPVIREPITGGRGSISGGFTLKEAQELANVLENPLEAPLKIEEERSVDPSLGRDSITSGVTASLIAAGATFAFMLVFYFGLGFVANFALLLNVLILLGTMCALDSTLTMPGIAGIALTIGMAVDANVLIYERMREEKAAGKSFRGVITAGYSKAFGAIFDSNLTTVMAAVILMMLGSGPVQGFGVTLTIGICASMFTALIVTRLIYDFLLSKGWLRAVRMLPLLKFPSFPFMNWGKLAWTVSAILILIGFVAGGVRGKQVMGVDFLGGQAMTLAFTERIGVDQLRAALEKAGVGDVSIQYQKNLSTGLDTLQVVTSAEAGAKAQQGLTETFPNAGFRVIGTDVVGATVGKQIQKSAGVATLLALFVILVYVAFRYEFSFAIAAVVALLHDVLITLGIYFLCGRQLTAPMVAAVLTIIGYSINDKIVIMDRIREDLKLGVRGSFKELINLALNQTLSRTIITGGAVILATFALLFFGGGVINDFAFTFLVGVLSGTYSSLLIASPLVLWYHKGERPLAFGQALSVQSGPAFQQSAAGAR
jgi:SecD/SecF fusion protein